MRHVFLRASPHTSARRALRSVLSPAAASRGCCNQAPPTSSAVYSSKLLETTQTSLNRKTGAYAAVFSLLWHLTAQKMSRTSTYPQG